MKVAFIEPEIGFKPYNALGTFPLGILYNATTIKKERPEYEVLCFDEDSRPVFQDGNIIEPYLLEADAVGISTKTATAPRAYAIADELRNLRARGKAKHNLQVIIGGIHATALPEEAIQHADCVVKGEGEGVITNVIDDRIEGIVKGKKIEDLDSVVEPEYSLIKYKKRKLGDIIYGNLASISTSRGCSYSCDFCSVWTNFGRKVRIESPGKTYNKLKSLRDNGFKRFFFHDDNFSNVEKHREDLFDRLMKDDLSIRFTVQDRIDLLQDGDYVEKMARSGCKAVMFSIESADEEFLKTHKKELDINKVEGGVKLLTKNNIISYAFCMVDFENHKATKKTLGLLEHLKIKYAQFTIPTPLPGSVLYQKQKEKICKGWEYFTGLTLVTERGKKMRDAAKHLSETWKRFYSPMGTISEILRFQFSQAALRLYCWNIGREILRVQPDY